MVGEPATFTATVVPVAPGAGTPTGTVTLDFGDGTAPVTLPLTDAVATTDHTYTSAAGSPYMVTIAYDGDADFTGSTRPYTHRVRRALTTTTVTSAPDPSVVGEAVTFTADVAPLVPGAGTPTGTVTLDFGDGATPATVSLTDGTATVSHSYTSRSGGPDAVIVTYSGDLDFVSSGGAALHTVNRAATTTTVADAPDPSVVGQQVTFTATVAPVTPGAGTPTGTVVFNFGDGSSLVTATLASGSATVTRPYTSRRDAPDTVTATYTGSTSFAGSSGTDPHTVNRALTTTTLVSSPDPSRPGQPFTLTATVTPVAPGAGTATGSVTFTIANRSSVSSPLVNGSATTAVNVPLNVGTHPITAAYPGSADFAGSTGTDTHTVTP